MYVTNDLYHNRVTNRQLGVNFFIIFWGRCRHKSLLGNLDFLGRKWNELAVCARVLAMFGSPLCSKLYKYLLTLQVRPQRLTLWTALTKHPTNGKYYTRGSSWFIKLLIDIERDFLFFGLNRNGTTRVSMLYYFLLSHYLILVFIFLRLYCLIFVFINILQKNLDFWILG